jgi:DNA repair exonuclease SbcCD ATPase subunit
VTSHALCFVVWRHSSNADLTPTGNTVTHTTVHSHTLRTIHTAKAQPRMEHSPWSEAKQAPSPSARLERSAVGLREQEAEIDRLGKENFNLRLRVFHLEERLAKKADPTADAPDAAQAELVELQLSIDALKRQVKEKDDILARAKEWMTSMQEALTAEKARAQEAAAAEQDTRRDLRALRETLDQAASDSRSAQSATIAASETLFACQAVATTALERLEGKKRELAPTPTALPDRANRLRETIELIAKAAAQVRAERAAPPPTGPAPPPRLSGPTVDVAALTAAVERANESLRAESVKAASLTHEVERRGLVISRLKAQSGDEARTASKLQAKLDQATQRLEDRERHWAEEAAELHKALRSAIKDKEDAETALMDATARHTTLTQEVARTTRRLTEAEFGWEEAAEHGGNAATQVTRLRSQLRAVTEQLSTLNEQRKGEQRSHAKELHKIQAEADKRVHAAESGADATKVELEGLRTALRTFLAPMMPEAPVSSSQIVVELRRLPQLTQWISRSASTIERAAMGKLSKAMDTLAKLEPKVERLHTAITTTSTDSVVVKRSKDAAAREDALEERIHLLETALAASASRSAALEESNRLLALELREKADRIQHSKVAAQANAAAASSLESCVDRLGLILVEAKRQGEAPSSATSAQLVERVSLLAADTLSVLERILGE